MKRDSWTNEEVIDILEGMKISGPDKTPRITYWNMGLEIAIGQFYDFKRPADEFAAMAYIPDTKEIVVVGPPLPR